eukprot:TRINITY_DN2017_c1_g1_i1.p1 TRINITY_DN2017_c1_g1~~TRINITY_DN2017_c1_g1_i1.p1  ORF type:complete len:414 (+),score=96.38 TRINITY_DN2017_c1_g1_i1:149-1390(+)
MDRGEDDDDAVKTASQRHPLFAEMIKNAVIAIGVNEGASLEAICSYISSHYSGLPANISGTIRSHLNRLVKANKLFRVGERFTLLDAPKDVRYVKRRLDDGIGDATSPKRLAMDVTSETASNTSVAQAAAVLLNMPTARPRPPPLSPAVHDGSPNHHDDNESEDDEDDDDGIENDDDKGWWVTPRPPSQLEMRRRALVELREEVSREIEAAEQRNLSEHNAQEQLIEALIKWTNGQVERKVSGHPVQLALKGSLTASIRHEICVRANLRQCCKCDGFYSRVAKGHAVASFCKECNLERDRVRSKHRRQLRDKLQAESDGVDGVTLHSPLAAALVPDLSQPSSLAAAVTPIVLPVATPEHGKSNAAGGSGSALAARRARLTPAASRAMAFAMAAAAAPQDRLKPPTDFNERYGK